MIKVYGTGAYLLGGTQIIEDTPERAARLAGCLKEIPSKEEATKQTMAYCRNIIHQETWRS